MSDELKHDPEFPFVVTNIGGVIIGRAINEFVANQLHKAMDKYGQVIDTTPKPKIPEDAEFIHYIKSGYDFYVRQLEDGTWKSDGGSLYSYSEILELVEDVAEVTVLVRKEEP